MSRSAVVADTPRYVLMDGTRRIGPKVIRLPVEVESSPIYGFSDKSHYDAFRKQSELALTPYPLVKAYLRSREQEHLDLVVLDASGPHEPTLHGATTAEVLRAHESRDPHVAADHFFSFDQDADVYRLDEATE